MTFTPDVSGDYHVTITSATNSLNVQASITVNTLDLNDIAGTGYDVTTDSLSNISDIEAGVNSGNTTVGQIFAG